MGMLRNNTDKLRALLPQAARERLYALHPGREQRWARHPGLQYLPDPHYVAITFDDGPDEDATPAVLDALDDLGVSATFFVLGSQVRAHNDLATELVRRGHEIALHGDDHLRHDRTDGAVSRDDIQRGAATIEDVLGVRCTRYRPPYGKLSDAATAAVTELGMTIVYWSAWGLDWEGVDAHRIAEVMSEQIAPGAILLLHDSARFARRSSALPTAEAIGLVVADARERGLEVTSLQAALGVRDITEVS